MNEAVAKGKLGVKALRDISKSGGLRFAAAMPEMANEVRIKVIEQFSAFKDLGKTHIDAVKDAHKSTLEANENSQNHFYQAAKEYQDALQAELRRDDLSREEREDFHDRLERNVRQVYDKDTENKQFLWGGMKLAVAGGATALALAVVYVGGRVAGASEDESEEAQQD